MYTAAGGRAVTSADWFTLVTVRADCVTDVGLCVAPCLSISRQLPPLRCCSPLSHLVHPPLTLLDSVPVSFCTTRALHLTPSNLIHHDVRRSEEASSSSDWLAGQHCPTVTDFNLWLQQRRHADIGCHHLKMRLKSYAPPTWRDRGRLTYGRAALVRLVGHRGQSSSVPGAGRKATELSQRSACGPKASKLRITEPSINRSKLWPPRSKIPPSSSLDDAASAGSVYLSRCLSAFVCGLVTPMKVMTVLPPCETKTSYRRRQLIRKRNLVGASSSSLLLLLVV